MQKCPQKKVHHFLFFEYARVSSHKSELCVDVATRTSVERDTSDLKGDHQTTREEEQERKPPCTVDFFHNFCFASKH